MDYDGDKVDDVMLALLWLTAFDETIGDDVVETRAWKQFANRHVDRLHEKGLIEEPRGGEKSIVFTEEGRQLSERLFRRFFGEGNG